MTHPVLVRHLQNTSRVGVPDADLLDAYTRRRDSEAFAVLVRRYGPLVWSVCRRQLRDTSSADDATQATFLALVRRARWVRAATLAAWLVGVARRTSRKMLLSDLRRRRREATAPPSPVVQPDTDMSVRDLLAVLDEEVEQLPLHYRSVLLACYWQGQTQAETAHQLGLSAASVKGLLERGRAKLLDRLRRRGVTADVALRGMLAAPLALAALPDRLRSQTTTLALTASVGTGWAPTALVGLVAGVVAAIVGVTLAQSEGASPPPAAIAPTAVAARWGAPPMATDVDDDPLPKSAILRLGTSRFKHPGNAIELILSPDDKTVVAYGGQWVTAWDASTGKKLWTAPSANSGGGGTAGERLLVASPDGKRAIWVGARDRLEIADIASGKCAQISVKGEPKNLRVTAVDISPGGNSLAVGTSIGVYLTDLTGAVHQKIANPGGKPAFGANGNDRLLFGGDYSFVRYAPGGKRLAVVTSDAPKSLRFCDPDTLKEQSRIELTAYLVRLAFSPDGSRVAVTERDNAVRVYEVAGGKRVHDWAVKLNNPFENYTSAVAWSPDGKWIAAGATDHAIYLWDAVTGKEAGRLTGSGWYPWGLSFSSDSNVLFSTGWDGVVRRWDVAAAKQLPLPNGAVRGSDVVAASRDGSRVAFATETDEIHIVDVETKKEVQRLKAADCGVSRMAFSPDGKYLAIGGSHLTQVNVVLWNLATGTVARRWDWEKGRDPHAAVEDIQFSPDGSQIAAVVFRQHAAHVLTVREGARQVLPHQYIYGLDFAPDGTMLATVGWDRVIRLWNPKTGQVARQVEVPSKDKHDDVRMYAVRFSPDGRTLATAHMRAHVSLWDVKSLQNKSRFEIGDFSRNALAYSSDGLRLATGNYQGVVVWDAQTGAKLWDRGNMGDSVYTVEFGRDGRNVLAGGNGVGYLWDTRPGDPPRKELPGLWADLIGDEAVAADRAFWALAERPAEVVPLLATKTAVRTAREVNADQVAKLIAKLGADDFKTRETAESELAKLGPGAQPQLVKALSVSDSPEARLRLGRLLARTADSDTTRRRYQRLTALLGQIDTPESRKLLRTWGDTAVDSLSEYATAALKRCSSRQP
ncbi:sigma-70 family RNA polymerase sigma factor [Gemmata massiliana]|uniref:sigma-70 family RNA polymerase sigma factor n=1 Tax=Gemmata massiliana TaxID=1210884 RepID=UPI0013A6A6CC|nr:sigma-70 family RNA polymerase sigma factor [Gemmata massiliana]